MEGIIINVQIATELVGIFICMNSEKEEIDVYVQFCVFICEGRDTWNKRVIINRIIITRYGRVRSN